VGLILAIINVADIARMGYVGFMDMTMYIAFMVFFIGMIATLVNKLLGYRTMAAWALLATGALTTLFFILALVRAGEFSADNLHIFPLVMQMIVLGLFPLVWGANKVVMRLMGDKKDN